ncbi:MAG TPA: hypothetical protein VMG63_01555 [Terriglobia bacterium]|nr:hypothetical protein [Terriglobia bacterium]
MERLHFQIVVPSHSVSVEEWRRALAAPISELPVLSEEQKEVAQKFGVTEEQYARNVLAGSYGQRRMHQRAQRLGEEVQEVLDRLGGGQRVIAVKRDLDRLGWVVRVETQQRDIDVIVSQELADDLLDSGSLEQRERLRLRVMSSLRQDEAATKR